jgi:catechol 2,3-dioxygenase-like lactoylglutathione lyase family enzyme
MAQFALHHVNVIVTDLPQSLAFYQNLFGLTIIERPPFKARRRLARLRLARLRRPAGAFDPLSVRLLPHRQRRRRRLPFCFSDQHTHWSASQEV